MDGLKFYRCNECGNLLVAIVDSSVVPSCCAKEMSILDNTTTSSGETDIEKHTPVIELVGDEAIVRVGGEEEPHPMTPEHRVDWVVFLDGGRVDIQRMSLANRPEARFTVYNRDSRLRAYACCNLHGLWESDDY